MHIYQAMDELLFITTDIPIFSQPAVFIREDQYMTSNMHPNIQLINQYHSILKMKDEDNETDTIKLRIATAERKEQRLIERERTNLEKMRNKQLNSSLSKHLAKCKTMKQELIEKGFSEEDSKRLCGKCKLPTPYHPDYRAEDLSNPFKFSFFCHNCVKKGKVAVDHNPITSNKTDKEYQNHYRKKHLLNYKCYCGKIITINENAKTDDRNFRRHIESNYHQIWSMLKEQQECPNIDYRNDLIDFSLFSVGQLRYIIKNNLNEKGKPLISGYTHKNKNELIKCLKENKDKLVISFDVLDIQKDKYQKKEKKEGIVYPELESDEEEVIYDSSSSSSNSDSSSDDDSD